MELFEVLHDAEMEATNALANRVNQMEAVLGRILAHLEHSVESQ